MTVPSVEEVAHALRLNNQNKRRRLDGDALQMAESGDEDDIMEHARAGASNEEDNDSSDADLDLDEAWSQFWVRAITAESWEYQPKAKCEKWVRQYTVSWRKPESLKDQRVIADDVDALFDYGYPAAIAEWRLKWPTRSPWTKHPGENALSTADSSRKVRGGVVHDFFLK